MESTAGEGEHKVAENDDDLVTLVDEEGHEHQFTLVDVVELDDRRYALMVPAGEEEEVGEDEEEEAFVFRLETDENGEEVLVDIDDDEEFERVCAAFDEIGGDEDDEDGEE
ncbi:MAG: DUF1292 domain-containing protein [Bacteroidota bacterium]